MGKNIYYGECMTNVVCKELRYRTGIVVQKRDGNPFTAVIVPFQVENLSEIKECVKSKLSTLPDINMDENGRVRRKRVEVLFIIDNSSEELFGKDYGLLRLEINSLGCKGMGRNCYPETIDAVLDMAFQIRSKYSSEKAETLKAESMDKLLENQERK
jgi:hypothetical protein